MIQQGTSGMMEQQGTIGLITWVLIVMEMGSVIHPI